MPQTVPGTSFPRSRVKRLPPSRCTGRREAGPVRVGQVNARSPPCPERPERQSAPPPRGPDRFRRFLRNGTASRWFAAALLFLHQPAAAVLQRPERLIGRNSGDQFHEVPGPLRLGGGLDLDQIEIVHHALVLPDLSLAGI